MKGEALQLGRQGHPQLNASDWFLTGTAVPEALCPLGTGWGRGRGRQAGALQPRERYLNAPLERD